MLFDPKSEVSVTSGVKSLVISVLKSIVSEELSPIVILPPIVIVEGVSKFPNTFISDNTSTIPVPFGVKSKLALLLNVEIVLSVILILSVSIVDATIASAALKLMSPVDTFRFDPVNV